MQTAKIVHYKDSSALGIMAKPSDFKLLVVDDEPELRTLLSERLKRFGFNVENASCGNEAIEMINSNQYDLVISDVRMPKGDGLSIVDHTATIENGPKVILVTGFSDIEEDEAIERGALKMMEKPIDRNTLLLHIKKELGIED